MSLEQVIETAKHLNSKERALVAHCLISSLETKQDSDVDQAWAKLADKRYAELAAGKAEAVTWEDIKKEVKS